jgi:ABC-type nitrate/sulfonate/bicarbonate transport system substrate-binding protein
VIATHATGELVALERGFYADEGLDVTIRPGGLDLNPIALVAGGSDDIGVTGGDQIILARSENVPVKAIAVLHQESPVVFFARRDSGIDKPQDFPGHTIGMKYGTNVETEYRAMMGKLGIDTSQVKEEAAQFDLTPFLTGRVEIWSGYEVNEPLSAEEQGVEVTLIRPRDYGVHFYSNTYFATEENLRERPEMLERFVRASLKGWSWALDNPEEAIDILLRHNPDADRDHELAALLKTRALMLTPLTRDAGLGRMEASRWEAMQELLVAQGILDRRLPIESFYSEEFLPPIGAEENGQ